MVIFVEKLKLIFSNRSTGFRQRPFEIADSNRLLMKFLNQIPFFFDLRKPDLRKNLDLRKFVGTTDFLVHKLFDLRKIF